MGRKSDEVETGGRHISSRERVSRSAAKPGAPARRFPIGAELAPGGVHLRVWAPRRWSVEALVEEENGAEPRAVELEAEEGGYFSGLIAGARAGTRYRLRLDNDRVIPDPASRFQPEGPHGPSQVVDPGAFEWTDRGWPGVKLAGQVIYEMHVGTFTPEGTWAAATRQLHALAELGVTLLEVMPIAEFPGSFGWGYDGVDLFAPTRLYGEPDDARRFVDEAHRLGLGVILDVVYNHFGPDGNYLRELADDWFREEGATDWGDAIDFDGPRSGPVREHFTTNAAHWIAEYHLDGLRLDATHSIHDASPESIVAAVGRAARAAAGERSIVILAENEPQDVRHVRPCERGGFGLDALWNDDFHHSAMVALTGRAEAYYHDHRGAPQEFVSAAKWGTLFQGQRYDWQGQRRGTPALDVHPAAFVTFLQNHDQVGNSRTGARGHELTTAGRWRAMTALLLLAPQTPMLFQGQEYSASQPFLYFADHGPELAAKVAAGRAEFLAQFQSLGDPLAVVTLTDPSERATFERCKLDPAERARGAEVLALHRDLLRLRREDPVLSRQRPRALDGAVLAAGAFALRFFGDEHGDRLLVVNLAGDVALTIAPEPLLAPPAGASWTIAWSSEDPRYAGGGTPPHEDDAGWRLQGHAALLLAPSPGATSGPR